jgi:hypothetical protein
MAENPVLQRLDGLVGAWEVQAIVGGRAVSSGRTKFTWVEDGQFLVQHTQAEPEGDVPPEWVANSPFPTTTMMGLDDTSETFTTGSGGSGVKRPASTNASPAPSAPMATPSKPGGRARPTARPGRSTSR